MKEPYMWSPLICIGSVKLVFRVSKFMINFWLMGAFYQMFFSTA
jgi:hypothetical protein